MFRPILCFRVSLFDQLEFPIQTNSRSTGVSSSSEKIAHMLGMGECRESANPHLAGLRVSRVVRF